MKKIYIALALILLQISFVSPNSYAQISQEEPLMIVRFNRIEVDYQKSLQKVIKMAKDIKPNVAFNIISFLPETIEEELQANEDEDLNKFKSSLLSLGVANENIRTSIQKSSTIENKEIHLLAK